MKLAHDGDVVFETANAARNNDILALLTTTVSTDFSGEVYALESGACPKYVRASKAFNAPSRSPS